MYAAEFLAKYYSISTSQLITLFDPWNWESQYRYNPLHDLPCLRLEDYLFYNINFRSINHKTPIYFNRFVDPDPNPQVKSTELIAECFPIKMDTMGIDWSSVIYMTLWEMEVCECNPSHLSTVLKKQDAQIY